MYSTHARDLRWSWWRVRSWKCCASDHWGCHRCRICKPKLVDHRLDVRALIYWDCSCSVVARDLESQEPADGPVVGDLPVVLDVGFESGDVLSSFWGYCHVVRCNCDDRVFVGWAPEENWVVDSGTSESKILYEDPAHFLVPPTTCLLQPIKAFHKVAHFSFFPWLKYSLGRLHVDHLLERWYAKGATKITKHAQALDQSVALWGSESAIRG